MTKYVYEVFNLHIYRHEVLRETERLVYVGRALERRLRKADVYETEEPALRVAIQQCDHHIELANGELAKWCSLRQEHLRRLHDLEHGPEAVQE